jgi:hypothetical protein
MRYARSSAGMSRERVFSFPSTLMSFGSRYNHLGT